MEEGRIGGLMLGGTISEKAYEWQLQGVGNTDFGVG